MHIKHGLDCPCDECKLIRKMLRDGVKTGKIHLVGLSKDKKKIMEGEYEMV